MTNIERKKICWVVTGAGHFLRETVDIMPSGELADVYLTRAASEVTRRYGVADKIENGRRNVRNELDHSSNAIIFFSMGRYSLLVIAPATSNTVAKCALGISDSLASNFFAQAGKSGVPILMLPTDVEPAMTSITPSGHAISITPRPLDLEYTRKIGEFPGVTVAKSVESLASMIDAFWAGKENWGVER